MLLVLTRNTESPVSKRLKKEANKKNIPIDIIDYCNIQHGVKNNKPFFLLPNGKRFEDYNKVILRSAQTADHSLDEIKYNIILYLDKNNIKTLNLNSYIKYPYLGKLAQSIVLANNNIKTIDFISFANQESLQRYLKTEIKYSVIVKSTQGSHGRTVKKASNIAELLKYVNEFKLENVLIQPLINCNQWYRTIVVKNNRGELEYLGYREQLQRKQYYGATNSLPIKKLSANQYEELKKLSLSCAKVFDLDYCGIDILLNENTNEFVVVEVNRTAVFTAFEKSTNVNVGDLLTHT